MRPGIPAGPDRCVAIRGLPTPSRGLRSGGRSPPPAAASSASSCSAVSVTPSEPRFSSTRAARRVPGIGTDGHPERLGAVPQPRQCDLCRRRPLLRRRSIRRPRPPRGSRRVRPRENRGRVRRKSAGAAGRRPSVTVPVRNPRPSGEYGTKPTPSSAAVGHDVGFDVAAPDRPFALHGRDRDAPRRRRAARRPSPPTARGDGPCPRRPARPSRRRFPRSAR